MNKFWIACRYLVGLLFISCIIGCQGSSNKGHVPQFTVNLESGELPLDAYYLQLAEVQKQVMLNIITLNYSLDEIYSNRKINKRADVGGAAVYGTRARLFTLKNQLARISKEQDVEKLTPLEQELNRFIAKYDEILALETQIFKETGPQNLDSGSRRLEQQEKIQNEAKKIGERIIGELIPKEYRKAYRFHVEYLKIGFDKLP